MSATESTQRLLARIRQGDREAWNRLFELVYDDLRKVAHLHLRGRGTGTLGTTAMVNETYLRLSGGGASWNDRVHFMAVASRAMRCVLVDHVRAKLALKRGGGERAVDIEEHHSVEEPNIVRILELEQALERLSELNERLVRVVELRFFGGLSVQETAEALNVGERTIERDWFKARSFLHRELESP
jgi:RNA polymerase sigma factor (TIGR02999 family)